MVPDAVFDEESDLSKFTKNQIVEILGGLLQGVFFSIGSALKHDHWKLSGNEAVELSKALYDCLKSLPAKQGKRVDKFLKEYAPFIKLFMVGSTILASRVGVSIQLSQLKKQNAELTRNADGPSPGPGESEYDPTDFVIG